MNLLGRLIRRSTSEPGPGGTLLDRAASLPPALLLSVALTAFVVLSVGAMRGESVTNDEVAHLPAGYTYLTRRDFRLNPEHPPLVKLLAALPLLLSPVHQGRDISSWKAGEQWAFGFRWLYQDGNDPNQILFRARLAMLIWPLILIVAVYAVARKLFGPCGAFVSLILATFSPELLAHGHFVATDVPVAACAFLAITAFWQFAEAPTVVRSLWAGVALGAALVTKYSAVLLIPAIGWGWIVSLWIRKAQADVPLPARERLRRILRIAALLALSAGTAYVLIWGVYGFRYSASPDPAFEYVWDLRRSHGTIVAKAVIFARQNHLLPEAYLQGFGFMFEHAQTRGAYALGRYSATGFWWYFPFAFLVKTPVSALLLMAWGVIGACRRAVRGNLAVPFFLIAPIVLGFAAAAGNINIGLRHIFPVFPCLFLLAGGLSFPESGARSGMARRSVLLLLGIAAAGAVSVYPHFLSHFNLPSLMVWKRHEMLVDSNMDWGQDLARLKRYLDQRGIADIKLCYFGNASPRALGLFHHVLPGVNAYYGRGLEREWPAAGELQPGDYVAVSVTCMVGVFFEDRDLYLRVLKDLKPEASIGHSILVYRIPDRPK